MSSTSTEVGISTCLLLEFAYVISFHSSISMAPYEAFCGRRCRSPIWWFNVDKSLILGPSLIYKTLEKFHIIRNRLQITHSWEKSYADHRRSDLEFEQGDKVYLKISPMKGVVRFSKKGNLSSHYLCPYEILKMVGKVAYEFKLLIELATVHPVLYVYMLKKCVGNPESILPIEGLGVKYNLSYEEGSGRNP